MKPNLILAVTFLSLTSVLTSAETPVDELMRDALYAEEVTRDADTAARQYSEILSRYEAQRNFAATALFRLAELRKKQSRKDEAISLYQRLLREFPDAHAESATAARLLAELGGQAPSDIAPLANPTDDDKELAKILSIKATSPDRLKLEDLLVEAASKDYFKTVRFLIQNGANPNSLGNGPYAGATPLASAAGLGNFAMAELLLAAGASPDGQGDSRPLSRAVTSRRPLMIDLLLRHKADPNSVSRLDGCTALAIAAENGDEQTVRKLIEAGANVNLVVPEINWTPLHFAIERGDIPATVRRLVDAGAKTDIVTLKPSRQDGSKIPKDMTALDLAVERNSPDLGWLLSRSKSDVDRLLARAIETKGSNSATIGELLKAGGNPDAKGRNGMPVLLRALLRWDISNANLLLDAGADPNSYFDGPDPSPGIPAPTSLSKAHSALRIVAAINKHELRDQGFQLFERLLQAGAKPDAKWMAAMTGAANGADAPSKASPRIEQRIAELFLIPAISGREDVSLVMGPYYQHIHQLQRRSGLAPRSLENLLLDPENSIKWSVIGKSPESLPTAAGIWRKGKEGKTTRFWQGTLTGTEPLPALQWGDVIQLSYPEPLDERNLEVWSRDEMEPTLRWELQRKMSFPVTVEIDGQPVIYQMRGDRVLFDPTKRELPWTDSLRVKALVAPDKNFFAGAVVSRKNWPDIELEWQAMSKFHLLPGDSVRFLDISDRSMEVETRKKRIRIESPGLPAQKSYPLRPSGFFSGDLPVPTLVALIADALHQPNPMTEGTPLPEYLQAVGAAFPFPIWLQPDLSAVRIRRLGEDGKESIIDIDLSAIISSTKDDASAEELRKLDPPLQGGDVVELPLKGDPEGTWRGLGDKEAAFFSKVLSRRIQHLNSDGKMELRELRFRSQKFIQTEAGKVPVATLDEVNVIHTTRLGGTLRPGSKASKLTREGKSYGGEAPGIFMLDGDVVETGAAQSPPSPTSDATKSSSDVTSPAGAGK